jgi:hypothetical protein
MTKLTSEKTIKRETAASERTRPITVTLFPHYVAMSLKGTREFYAVPWGAVLDLGRKIEAREKLAARQRTAEIRRRA